MSEDRPRRKSKSSESLPRQVIEFLVCLIIAVTLFKTFEAEGYLISTGSMAPTLLGYHKRANCPSCGWEFEIGAATPRPPKLAVCPNCGQRDIDIRSLPRNDGDQLLVHKTAYSFRDPKRWEVVVFRNPQQPNEAYVKRLLGLPGETLQIRNGDVYVNGRIQTKGLTAQRGMRILVHDDNFRPKDPQWQPRWRTESGWKSTPNGYVCARPETNRPESPPTHWLTYRHWIRSGGNHETRVDLASWPDGLDLQEYTFEALRYDVATGQLVYRGAMPDSQRTDLMRIKDPKFQVALETLYRASHLAPIADTYSYNRPGAPNGGTESVRDFMLALQVDSLGGPGELDLEINDGRTTGRCVFDLKRAEVRLEIDGISKPVRTSTLPEALLHSPWLLEFSLMDHQFLLAADGRLLFAPWTYSTDGLADDGSPPRSPIRIGAREIAVQISHLQLFRDVYYTSENGLDRREFRMSNQPGAEEYFMLGDNSPVSIDSRYWPADHPVTRGLLLGKPFLVHLPARSANVQLGTWRAQIRIPDLSRIRYIR